MKDLPTLLILPADIGAWYRSKTPDNRHVIPDAPSLYRYAAALAAEGLAEGVCLVFGNRARRGCLRP